MNMQRSLIVMSSRPCRSTEIKSMIKRCLIVDTETTNLPEDGGLIIEVGAILYSVVNQSVLQQFSTLLTLPESVEESTNPSSAINRISESMLEETDALYDGNINETARQFLVWLNSQADIVVAHNADFDKYFLKQIGFTSDRWLCSKHDMNWPAGNRQRRDMALISLAVDYGVPVVDVHRALDDCRLLASIFSRVEDLQGLFTDALLPRGWYVSHVPIAQNHLVKTAGFRWNEPIPKHWAKRLTPEEAAALPFPTSPVRGVDDGEFVVQL